MKLETIKSGAQFAFVFTGTLLAFVAMLTILKFTFKSVGTMGIDLQAPEKALTYVDALRAGKTYTDRLSGAWGKEIRVKEEADGSISISIVTQEPFHCHRLYRKLLTNYPSVTIDGALMTPGDSEEATKANRIAACAEGKTHVFVVGAERATEQPQKVRTEVKE